MNKVTSTIAVLIIGLAALIAYVLVTNRTVIDEDVQFQAAEISKGEVVPEMDAVIVAEGIKSN